MDKCLCYDFDTKGWQYRTTSPYSCVNSSSDNNLITAIYGGTNDGFICQEFAGQSYYNRPNPQSILRSPWISGQGSSFTYKKFHGLWLWLVSSDTINVQINLYKDYSDASPISLPVHSVGTNATPLVYGQSLYGQAVRIKPQYVPFNFNLQARSLMFELIIDPSTVNFFSLQAATVLYDVEAQY
jgi:hypothetical protein